MESNYNETYKDLNQTRTERDRLADDLRTARADITALKRRLSTATEQLEELERQLKSERAQKSELLKTRAQLNASIEEMTRALGELAERKAQAEERIREFRDLLGRFQELIDAGRLKVRIIDGRMVVQLATDVLFSSGSASLSAEGRKAIREVAEVFAEIPDRRFQVEGHTDDVPIRTERFPSNWELASARALTVLREMLEAGLPPQRVSAASYGEFDPVAPNRTPQGKAQNRRIQIVVVPDLDSLPGTEELQRISSDD
ncbi:MAG: endoflagellar motor protein [Deltaproteobacteria bacterium]|nr:MAG: endoflagellar motor protein [Deltaproteobacteria bacterium]